MFLGVNTNKAKHTLWNFADAQTLKIQWVNWQGSILAPRAEMMDMQGVIHGQVFGKSWTVPDWNICMQINRLPFEGCLPDAVVTTGTTATTATTATTGTTATTATTGTTATTATTGTTGVQAAIGCSDGSREGFVDTTKYPCIASCNAFWSVPGLFDKQPTCNRQSGNGFPVISGCSAADACAPGWHVCASIPEVSARLGHSGSCSEAGTSFYAAAVV